MDIRTDFEKKTAERRDKVVSRYKEYRDQYPEASDNRIFGCIADEMKLTITGVRNICIEMGATQPIKEQTT